ncbi:zf-HC2 domain-containing protein [Candidatus Omnitrophota bacterium]
MNCEKIQDLLITDYIDGEANEKTRRMITDHLAACDKCRVFEKTVQEKVVKPFKGAQKETPPEFIWHRVRRGIVEDGKPAPRKAWFVLKPAFATALVAMAIFAIIIVSGRLTKDRNGVDIYITDQIEFLIEPGSSSDSDSSGQGLGTAIEIFLLS